MKIWTHAMPVGFIMGRWKPGTFDFSDPEWDWNWQTAIAYLKKRGELHAMSEQIMRDGKFDTVVNLGPDGRIWDGTDIVVAAYMKGVSHVLCTFSFIEE